MNPENQNEYYYKLLKEKLPSPVSAHTYISRFSALLQKPEFKHVTIRALLVNPNKYWPVMRKVYVNINTLKTTINSVLACYRYDDRLKTGHAQQYKRWTQLHTDMQRLLNMDSRQNKMNDKQKKNYVAWSEIKLKVSELQRDDPFSKGLRHAMKYLLLVVITDVTPKRADFGALRIYYDADPDVQKQNYIVVNTQRNAAYIVLQNYKTSKTFMRHEEDLKPETVRVIKQSLRRYPREYLFIDSRSRPYLRDASYSEFVRNTFGTFWKEKKLGVSLYRHVFLSEAVDWNNMTGQEQTDLARDMQHSVGQQQQYRFITKESESRSCNCVCTDK